MAVRKLAPEELQPTHFAFTSENEAFADEVIAKYPPRPAGLGGDRAAVARAGAERRLAAAEGDRGGRREARHGRRSA